MLQLDKIKWNIARFDLQQFLKFNLLKFGLNRSFLSPAVRPGLLHMSLQNLHKSTGYWVRFMKLLF